MAWRAFYTRYGGTQHATSCRIARVWWQLLHLPCAACMSGYVVFVDCPLTSCWGIVVTRYPGVLVLPATMALARKRQALKAQGKSSSGMGRCMCLHLAVVLVVGFGRH